MSKFPLWDSNEKAFIICSILCKNISLMIVVYAECNVDTHVSNFLTMIDVNRLVVFAKHEAGNLLTPD